MNQSGSLGLLQTKLMDDSQIKLIQEFKRVSSSLEREQESKKINAQRLRNMQRKISCLQFLQRNNQKESQRYQRKLQKLETTQGFATELLRIKYQSFLKQQQGAKRRRQQCFFRKEELKQQRRLSHSIFERRKGERIRKIRQEVQQVSVNYQRKSKEVEAMIKCKKQSARYQQEEARHRLRRYENFKLQQAALNYAQKVQAEAQRLRQRSQVLSELRGRVHRQEDIFRKTQILEKETHKIESIYLTGSDF